MSKFMIKFVAIILWILNQILDYTFKNENFKILIIYIEVCYWLKIPIIYIKKFHWLKMRYVIQKSYFFGIIVKF